MRLKTKITVCTKLSNLMLKKEYGLTKSSKAYFYFRKTASKKNFKNNKKI